MVAVADVEAIFRRHGWSYALTEDGRIATNFDGVGILLTVDAGELVRLASVAFRAAATERRAMQAHANDLDTFLAAVNRVEPEGHFELDRTRATVFYATVVTLGGGAQDDQRLGRSIALTVSAVRAIGSVVRDLVRGRLTLQQTLDILNRAVAEAERERRRRSA
jgi:hypothetical protein